MGSLVRLDRHLPLILEIMAFRENKLSRELFCFDFFPNLGPKVDVFF